ncbi:YkgJ family cysteine cluster protein [Streptomyces sp. NPDC001744]|uniref:YkgJ family cysteine cluster protein n=1 Tax=Streptomyces sp. NPDC001744 TaxID=3364606 RepID=UPI0036845C83
MTADSDNAPGTDGAWQSSRAKGLCYRGPRLVTGADIVRIARTLALEPAHFVQTAPAAADDPTGVVLDNARRRVNIRIANAAHGCVFHVRTLEGSGRCGLGEQAPLTCRMYPVVPRTDGGAGPPDAETAPRGNADDGGPGRPGRPLDAEGLAWAERRWAADRDHWFEIVAHWNDLPKDVEDPPGAEDFQRYLLEAHAAREAGLPWPGEVVA